MDELDRKILELLEQDSRQSLGSIARKLRKNKTLVSYRIARLEREIITGYSTITSQASLGRLSYCMLLQFCDLSLKEQTEILAIARKQSAWCTMLSGRWDMMIVFIEKDMESFLKQKDKIFRACSTHISAHSTYIEYEGVISCHDYLYTTPKGASVYYSMSSEDMDRIEQGIYDMLRREPKASLLNIARRLGKSYDTIRSRYENMRSRKIILRCSPRIAIERLGYKQSICLITTTPPDDKIMQFCINHPNIIRCSRALGEFNMILTIDTKDDMQLKEIISQLKSMHGQGIRSCDIVQAI